MASIGEATLTIVPKFDGLSAAVDKALAEAEGGASKRGQALGESASAGFGGGLAKSGVVIGAFSALTAKAMDSISSHVGAAVSRFDTMNAFPAVMESLGYSAADSEAAIGKMSDRLGNLPTTLDSMTGAVQRIVPAIKDVGRSTDIMLALNDAIVAGKGPIEIQNAAIEQFSQAVSRGRFELEEWRSVQTAMPGQLDQVAKSMLGAEAGAMDLYEALKRGDVSMGDFLATLVRLDTEGGEGFASFQRQAETAAGGVSTSMANMGNAVTKGLAKLMDTVGEGNISGVFDDMKGAINAAFDALNSGAAKAMPLVEKVYAAMKDVAPQAVAAAAGFAAFKVAGAHLVDFAGRAKEARRQAGLLEKANTLLGASMSPASLGVTAAAAGLAIVGGVIADTAKKARDFEAATSGLADAVDRALALDEYSAHVANVGETAGVAAMSVSDMVASVAEHAEAMERNTKAAETQISQLSTAQGIIGEYAGQTDLSADAQGRLEWALKLVNEEFGLSITAADVMADSYVGADGAASDLTDTINGLVDAKKNEIRMNALSANLTEAYAAESEAASALAGAKKTLAEKQEEYSECLKNGTMTQQEYDTMVNQCEADLRNAQDVYDTAVEKTAALENEMGDASVAVSENADEWDRWGSKLSSLVTETLKQSVGENGLGMLKEDLRALGVSTEKLSELSEAELEKVAAAYDGTAASVVGVLDELGIKMDESMLKTAKAATSIKEAFDGFGEGFGTALETAGVDLDTLAWKMAEAGVSTETLNLVGSANMAALAEATGGNISQMVGFLQMYNAEPLIDKNGNVNVNDVQLVDAQGNLYTWNGSTLVDQNGNAAIEDTSVMDAQGHKVTWNGTSLEYQDAEGRVYDFMSGGIAQRDAWNDHGLSDWEGSGTINIFKNITETVSRVFGSKNAAGGVRLHADGGIRPHASGAFIATRAMPLDIVGEDGAEAIVPLTNRRYSQPFADIIAEGVSKRMLDVGGGDRVNQTINIYQPVKSPAEMAREMRRQARYGLAGARGAR